MIRCTVELDLTTFRPLTYKLCLSAAPVLVDQWPKPLSSLLAPWCMKRLDSAQMAPQGLARARKKMLVKSHMDSWCKTRAWFCIPHSSVDQVLGFNILFEKILQKSELEMKSFSLHQRCVDKKNRQIWSKESFLKGKKKSKTFHWIWYWTYDLWLQRCD